MFIGIKLVPGDQIFTNIQPTDRVNRIKEIVEYEEGTPYHDQVVVFGGRILQDGDTIEECRLDEGSLVRVYRKHVYNVCEP